MKTMTRVKVAAGVIATVSFVIQAPWEGDWGSKLGSAFLAYLLMSFILRKGAGI